MVIGMESIPSNRCLKSSAGYDRALEARPKISLEGFSILQFASTMSCSNDKCDREFNSGYCQPTRG
jgi:hypothetical protein